jgi:hypothetical protein
LGWEVSWRELSFGLSVWLCAWATADGESGSSTVVFLKTTESLGL